MKIKYNREEDILVIEVIADGVIDHAEQSGSIISHFNENDALVLLEILNASQFLTTLMRVAMREGENTLVPAA